MLILMLALTEVVFPAITFVQGTGNTSSNNNTDTCSPPSEVTAGHLLIIGVGVYNWTPAESELTMDAGTAVLGTIRIDTVFYDAGCYHGHAVWSVPVQTSGSCRFYYHRADFNNCYPRMSILEVAGADTLSATRKVSGCAVNAGNSTAPAAGNITMSGGGIFIGGLSLYYTTPTITPGGNYTSIYADGEFSAEYRIVASGATDSPDWSLSGGIQWVCVGVGYNAYVPSSPGPEILAVIPASILTDSVCAENSITLVGSGMSDTSVVRIGVDTVLSFSKRQADSIVCVPAAARRGNHRIYVFDGGYADSSGTIVFRQSVNHTSASTPVNGAVNVPTQNLFLEWTLSK